MKITEPTFRLKHHYSSYSPYVVTESFDISSYYASTRSISMNIIRSMNTLNRAMPSINLQDDEVTYEQLFSYIKQHLILSDIWKDMENVKEDSAYHREENVAVHTEMTLEKFDEMFEKNVIEHETEETAPLYAFIVKMALLFHDVGKPAARKIPENCVKDDQGNVKYYKFSGHEKLSARIFEDFIVSKILPISDNISSVLNQPIIYAIGWLIEHHLPYGIKKPQKRQMLYKTLTNIFGVKNIKYFKYMVMSDALGRISDDQEGTIKRASDWLDTFINDVDEFNDETFENRKDEEDTIGWGRIPKADTDKDLIMLIGCSGSGKSSKATSIASFNNQINPGSAVIYSFDNIRSNYFEAHLVTTGTTKSDEYDNDVDFYRDAYDWFNKMSKGEQNEIFTREFLKLKNNDDIKVIIVDNTNVSKKRRAMFLNNVDKTWNKSCILFITSLDIINKNQQKRSDKFVNENTCKNMYMSIQYPSFGEFDTIKFA